MPLLCARPQRVCNSLKRLGGNAIGKASAVSMPYVSAPGNSECPRRQPGELTLESRLAPSRSALQARFRRFPSLRRSSA
eukprot:719350-Rhodomonas_salina.1